MAEYIEREAAIAVIYGQHVGGKEACENARPNTYGADLREIVADIEDVPAADVAPRCPHYIRNVHDRGDDSLCDKWGCEVEDVAPVRHGRWIESENGPLQKCSVCGATGWDGFYYCTNCGAKMDAEAKE